jgi:hypothetical protein
LKGYSLFLQKLVQILVRPHEQHILPMDPHIEGATQSTNDADQCKDEQLLGIERKVHGEIGGEQGFQRVRFLEPHGQQTEHGSTTDGGEEAAPIVPHRKVGGGYFNAEQYACERENERWCKVSQKNERREKENLPPTGAAKQAPTPTAHAAANISEFRDSFSKILWNDVTNLLNNCATILAICTKGP